MREALLHMGGEAAVANPEAFLTLDYIIQRGQEVVRDEFRMAESMDRAVADKEKQGRSSR